MPGTHHLRGIDDSSVVAKLERAYCSNGDGKDQRCGDLGVGREEETVLKTLDNCLLLIKEMYYDACPRSGIKRTSLAGMGL